MDIEPITDDSIKFVTCKFRSDDLVLQTVSRCQCQGGDYQIEGFLCHEREIFQVSPEICKECEIYQSR